MFRNPVPGVLKRTLRDHFPRQGRPHPDPPHRRTIPRGGTFMTLAAQRSSQTADVTVEVMDAAAIKSIQLADGWHAVNNCEFTQFAVGKAHSPITPGKLFPALRYTD